MTLPKLTPKELLVAREVSAHGSVTTDKRYGQPKRVVKALVDKGILVSPNKYASPVRYQFSPYGFALAEWMERQGNGKPEIKVASKTQAEEARPVRRWWMDQED